MDRAIERFIDHLERVENRSKNTILAYKTDVRQFNQVISTLAGFTVMPRSLSGEWLQGYSTWLEEQGYRPATLARKIAAVKAFLEYLRKEEEIDTAVHRALLKSPQPVRPEPRVLSNDELIALLNSPLTSDNPRGMRDAAILSLLTETGMRASDVIGLEITDIDVERGRLKHPLKQRWIPLGRSLPILQRYLHVGRPHQLKDPNEQTLFLNLRGQKLSRQGLWLVVRRWAQFAGIEGPVSPHSLRHTLVHQLIQQGKTRKDIQEVLGLSSPNAIRVHFQGKKEGNQNAIPNDAGHP
jgi:integrase/recombinase XerD